VAEITTILIDDDPLVRLTWKMSADRRGISLKSFSRVEDFEQVKAEIDLKSPIYIDSQLQAGVRGEQVARELFLQGFQEIRLATGYDSSEFKNYLGFVKEVVGKDPPWD